MRIEFEKWLSQFCKTNRKIENTKTNDLYYVAWDIIHKNDSRIPYCHNWIWFNSELL
jgi:hypothetical protein